MQGYAGNVSLPQQQSTNISPTISSAQNVLPGIQQLGTGVTAGTLPQAIQTEQQLYSNPYAGGLQQGAGTASQLGQQAALTGYGTGASMLPYAQQIMQTGFDPQQALYNRTLGQVTDQQRAGAAASGVGTSPYATGLENQALSNFNIDWQNQQLGRQATAASAGGGLAQQGVGMMNAAPTQYLQSAAMPYSTYGQIGSDQNAAIQQLLANTGQMQTQQNLPYQDYLSLLSGQNQANQVANQQANAALQQSQLGWNQMAQLGQGIGSAAGLMFLSDARFKADIKPVGRLDNGLTVYTFRYRHAPELVQIGLLAQEVEKVKPLAVQEIAGVKYVDYAKVL